MAAPTPAPSRHEEFVPLYVRHEPAVFSFVLAMVQNTADAEDVAQRASMTMWRCFDQYQPGTSFRNWAFQIAKNAALNHLTKVSRDRHVFGEKLVALLVSALTQSVPVNAHLVRFKMCHPWTETVPD